MTCGHVGIVLALGLLSSLGQAGTIYVNDQSGNDAWSGLCETWDGQLCGPKKTIAAGMAAANAGDTVVIAAGVYKGAGNRDLNFAGKAITVQSADPTDPRTVAKTVIDCEGTAWEPHRAFRLASGEGLDSVIAGLTIRNGLGPEENQFSTLVSAGGAIYLADSSVTIKHCVFSGNRAAAGGAVAGFTINYNHSPQTRYRCVVRDCTFADNVAGGIGSPIMGSSGAVDAIGGTWTLDGCRFVGNACLTGFMDEVGGGALQLARAALTARRCEFTMNKVTPASGVAGNGGALFVDEGYDTALIGCAFSDNRAARHGGAIHARKTTVNLVGCRFDGNSAGTHAVSDGAGGAVSAALDTVIAATNCVFVGNRAIIGGALANVQAPRTLALACSTVFANRAERGAGLAWSGGWRSVSNSVIWNGSNWFEGGTLPIRYSNVQGGWSGTGNIDADPLFVRPGHWDDNGTPGDPRDDFWVSGDQRLGAGSPCIDAASNPLVPADVFDLNGNGNTTEPVPFDVAGNPRFFDDPETPDTGEGPPPIVDMGAYEFLGAGILVGDVNCDGHVDAADIGPFVLAIADPAQYAQQYPDCPPANRDLNRDGYCDFGDINPFVALLTGP